MSLLKLYELSKIPDKNLRIVWEICYFLSENENFCNEALKKINGHKDTDIFQFFQLNKKRNLEEWKKIIEKICREYSNRNREKIKGYMEIIFGKNLKFLNISQYEKDFLLYHLLDKEKINEIKNMIYDDKDKDKIAENFSRKYIGIETKSNFLSFKLSNGKLENPATNPFVFMKIIKNIKKFTKLLDLLGIENYEKCRPGFFTNILLLFENFFKIILFLIYTFFSIVKTGHDNIIQFGIIAILIFLTIIDAKAAANDKRLYGGLSLLYFNFFLFILIGVVKVSFTEGYRVMYYVFFIFFSSLTATMSLLYAENYIMKKKFILLKEYILKMLSIYEF